MKTKILQLVRTAAAMIVFMVSSETLTEFLAIVLMRMDLNQESLLMVYQIGSKMITLLIAFPLFILVLRLWGKLKRFSWEGKRKPGAKKFARSLAAAILPLILLYGIILVMIYAEKLPADAVERISSGGELL